MNGCLQCVGQSLPEDPACRKKIIADQGLNVRSVMGLSTWHKPRKTYITIERISRSDVPSFCLELRLIRRAIHRTSQCLDVADTYAMTYICV